MVTTENSMWPTRSGVGVICDTTPSSLPAKSEGISALKSMATMSHSAFMRLHISRASSGSKPVSRPLGSITLNGG